MPSNSFVPGNGILHLHYSTTFLSSAACAVTSDRSSEKRRRTTHGPFARSVRWARHGGSHERAVSRSGEGDEAHTPSLVAAAAVARLRAGAVAARLVGRLHPPLLPQQG